MSDFKIGDEIWYTSVMGCVAVENCIEIESDTIKIIFIDKHGKVHYFTGYNVDFKDGDYDMVNGYVLEPSEMYKSKQECIDAFKKRLDEL